MPAATDAGSCLNLRSLGSPASSVRKSMSLRLSRSPKPPGPLLAVQESVSTRVSCQHLVRITAGKLYSGGDTHAHAVASVAVVNPRIQIFVIHNRPQARQLTRPGMAGEPEVETIGEAHSAAEGSVLPDAEATHEVRGC